MNKWMYYIFEHWNGQKQFWIGLFVTVFGSVLAYTVDMRYVGLFNINTLSPKFPFYTPLLDNVVNVLLLSISLFLVGLLLNRRSRFMDILNVALLSRGALYLGCLLNINGFLVSHSEKLMEQVQQGNIHLDNHTMVIVLATSVFSMLFLVVSIWMLYAGFKTATNGKGAKIVVTFIVTLLILSVVPQLFAKQLYYPFTY